MLKGKNLTAQSTTWRSQFRLYNWKRAFIMAVISAPPLAYNACGGNQFAVTNNVASSSGFVSRSSSGPVAVSNALASISVTFPKAVPVQKNSDGSTPVNADGTVKTTASITSLSAPLLGPAKDVEPITTVAANSITSVVTTPLTAPVSATATWTSNEYASQYYLHVSSGANAGLNFLISSNQATNVVSDTNAGTRTTTNTLVLVNPNNVDLTQLLAKGDLFEIVQANTLATLFGTSNTTVAQTGADPSTSGGSGADYVNLWNGTAWVSYYENGTNWILQGTNQISDSVVVPPDTGLLFVHKGTAAATLVMTGRVPASSLTSLAPAAGTSSMIGNRFPVAMTLSSLGLQNSPGWNSNVSSTAADHVSLWNGSVWVSYYYDGKTWRTAGSTGDYGNLTVDVATAISVQKLNGTSPADPAYTQTAPYSLNTMTQ